MGSSLTREYMDGTGIIYVEEPDGHGGRVYSRIFLRLVGHEETPQELGEIRRFPGTARFSLRLVPGFYSQTQLTLLASLLDELNNPEDYKPPPQTKPTTQG